MYRFLPDFGHLPPDSSALKQALQTKEDEGYHVLADLNNISPTSAVLM